MLIRLMPKNLYLPLSFVIAIDLVERRRARSISIQDGVIARHIRTLMCACVRIYVCVYTHGDGGGTGRGVMLRVRSVFRSFQLSGSKTVPYHNSFRRDLGKLEAGRELCALHARNCLLMHAGTRASVHGASRVARL